MTCTQNSIRPATKEDIPSLVALEQEIFPATIYGADVLDRKKFLYLLTKANALVLVCTSEKKICGYVIILLRKTSSAARVYSIAVSPDHRGKGIAPLLLDHAQNICREKNCTRIILETREDNSKMRGLCARLGYKETKRVKGYYHDGQTAIKLSKDIPASGS